MSDVVYVRECLSNSWREFVEFPHERAEFAVLEIAEYEKLRADAERLRHLRPLVAAAAEVGRDDPAGDVLAVYNCAGDLEFAMTPPCCVTGWLDDLRAAAETGGDRS